MKANFAHYLQDIKKNSQLLTFCPYVMHVTFYLTAIKKYYEIIKLHFNLSEITVKCIDKKYQQDIRTLSVNNT